jgi:hypothetical protein
LPQFAETIGPVSAELVMGGNFIQIFHILANSGEAFTIGGPVPRVFFVFFFPGQRVAPNRGDTFLINKEHRRGGRKEREERDMKKRWMKSVIETSKQPAPALPFQRSVRRAAKPAPAVMARLKTA